MLHVIAVRTPENTAAHANLLERYLERADIISPSNTITTLGDLFLRDMAYAQLRNAQKTFKELFEADEFMLEGEISPYFQRIYELAQKHKKPDIILIEPPSSLDLSQAANFLEESGFCLTESTRAFLEQGGTNFEDSMTDAVMFAALSRMFLANPLYKTAKKLCDTHAAKTELKTWLIALNEQHTPAITRSLADIVKPYNPWAVFELNDYCPQQKSIVNYAISKQQEELAKQNPNDRLNNPSKTPLSTQLATDLALEAIFSPLYPEMEITFAHAHTIATLDAGEKKVLIRLARQNAQALLSPELPFVANTLAETCGIRQKDPARTFEKHYPFDWDAHYSTKSL